jgi:hypothetical protein
MPIPAIPNMQFDLFRVRSSSFPRAPRGARLRDDTILHQCPPFPATPATQRQLRSAVVTPFTRYSTRVQPHNPTVFSWFPQFVIPSEPGCYAGQDRLCPRVAGDGETWACFHEFLEHHSLLGIVYIVERCRTLSSSSFLRVLPPCRLLGSPVPTHRSGLIFLADFYWPHRAGLD